MKFSRRQFLCAGGGVAMLAAVPLPLKALASSGPMGCPFRLAVINDEISQDFEHDCHMAAKELVCSGSSYAACETKSLLRSIPAKWLSAAAF